MCVCEVWNLILALNILLHCRHAQGNYTLFFLFIYSLKIDYITLLRILFIDGCIISLHASCVGF